jgi:hypothetical protein
MVNLSKFQNSRIWVVNYYLSLRSLVRQGEAGRHSQNTVDGKMLCVEKTTQNMERINKYMNTINKTASCPRFK